MIVIQSKLRIKYSLIKLDVITNYPLPSTTANYTPIVISPTYDFWTEGMYTAIFVVFKTSLQILSFFINVYS